LPHYEVSFVVFDHNQAPVEEYGRVKVYRHSHYKSSEGTPATALQDATPLAPAMRHAPSAPAAWLTRLRCAAPGWVRKSRSFLRRLLPPDRAVPTAQAAVTGPSFPPDAMRIYQEIDADIYCAFGVNGFVGEVAWFCKQFAKTFVVFSGSDIDFDAAYHNNGSYMVDIVNQADILITQNSKQSCNIRRVFEKNSVIIKNPVELNSGGNVYKERFSRNIALWIGKSDKIKQPNFLIKLAKRFAYIRFVMIMNISDHEIFVETVRNKPANVEILERVAFSEVQNYFENAVVMVNTSVFEGFPNTFLQAGTYGVPLLSLHVDPDGFIQQYGCGVVAHGRFRRLARGLAEIFADTPRWNVFSQNISRYVQAHHSVDEKIREFHGEIAKIAPQRFFAESPQENANA